MLFTLKSKGSRALLDLARVCDMLGIWVSGEWSELRIMSMVVAFERHRSIRSSNRSEKRTGSFCLLPSLISRCITNFFLLNRGYVVAIS